jgi:hypothetical protein
MKPSSTVMLLAVLSLAAAPATAANTNNYSDQWVAQDEPGWGVSIHQQASVLFVNLFVYGPDRNPTWYSAAAYLQAGAADHDLFIGDLYVTNGPWFGAGSFAPVDVGARKVGTLAFSAVGMSPATLTYTVDGLAVTKSVVRQTWALEDFTGTYIGGAIEDVYCQDRIGNGHYEYAGAIEITEVSKDFPQSDISITVPGNGTCTFTIPRAQSGHFGGSVGGTYDCVDRPFGSGTVYAAERSVSGVTARYEASFVNSVMGQPVSCTAHGRLGGVRR